jgi:RNA polymerase-binding transcription factor DksA
MSQQHMFSHSPAKTSDGKSPSAPKLHCFEFRTLLQAKRQKLLDKMREKIAVLSETQELQDIEVALARIGDDSYGICIDCSGEIGRARLKTDPAAKRCLPCQILVSPI